MSELSIDIITAEKALLESIPAESVTAPGVEGTFQVLPGHTSLLTTLETGPVVVEGPEGTQSFVVKSGFAEVMQGHIRILADQAEAAAELKTENVQSQLQDVEKQAGEVDPFSDEAEALYQQRRYLELQQELLG